MIPTSLEKLGRPAELPRDAYEATEEGTARPIVRATLTMALVSALSLMKDLLYGKKAEAFTPSTDEPEPESAEAAVENVKPSKVAAAAEPDQEPSGEGEEESVELSSAAIETAAIRGSSRLVYFATGDSLELGQIGYAAPGPLGRPRRPVNDNGTAGVDDAGDAVGLKRVSNLGSKSGGSGGSAGSGGGADEEAPDSDTGSGPRPDDADDEGAEGDGEPRLNRAPSVAGNLALRDVFINQIIIISLVDLLSRVTDADGDRLSVTGLTASEGTVSRIDDRTWLFTPAKDDVGRVDFAYTVTDGQATVTATASVDIRELPGSTLFGTEGNDILIGTPGSDFIYALGGDDEVVGREWSDVIEGGDGNDRLLGGDGDDVLDGGAGDDQLFGGAGNDVLYGRAGSDVLFGEGGDDILLGGEGADWLNGGDGQDLLKGEAGDDRLEGGADGDYLDGGEGADRIAGDAGNDVLVGGMGADRLQGGEGDDTFVATAADGDDSMVGGDGADTVDFGALAAPVTVDLDAGTATGADTGSDTIAEIENVVGTAGGDVITGDEAANRITGAAGEDVLQGGGGDDTFVATAADGDDSMVGGDGADTLDYSAIATPVVVDLEEGRASGAGIGTDQIAEIENVIAGSGDDTLIADEAISTFVGGAGADVFVFRTAASAGRGSGSRDRIEDLDVGDRIDIKDISREFERAFGDVIDDQDIKKFVLVKDSDTFSRPGEIRITYEDLSDGRITIIEGNIDFDSDTDFEIELVGDKLIDETYFRSGQD